MKTTIQSLVFAAAISLLPFTAIAQSSDHEAVDAVMKKFMSAYITADNTLATEVFRKDGVMIGYSVARGSELRRGQAQAQLRNRGHGGKFRGRQGQPGLSRLARRGLRGAAEGRRQLDDHEQVVDWNAYAEARVKRLAASLQREGKHQCDCWCCSTSAR